MSASYDPALPTARDWVRFLTAFTDVDAPVLSDEEIAAVLVQEAVNTASSGAALQRYAAARCIDAAAGRAFAKSTTAGGLTEKTVRGLTLKWGIDASSVAGWRARSDALRAEAAWLNAPQDTSRLFRVL